MITINNIEYRTLEEQVRKNKEDIEVLKNYDVSITGHVSSADELPESADNGTMYIVGNSPSYDLYVYVDGWIDLGDYPATGPKGETGERGPIGLMGERGSQWYTLEKPASARQNDQFLDSNGIVYQYTGTNWQATNNIRGPQGIIGPIGPRGEKGDTGPIGPQGIRGPAGAAFSVIGLIANTSQLPDPSTVPDNYAYMVGTAAPYDLYVQVVPEGEPQQWLDAGQVEGVVGPPGPIGAQGEKGDPGPQGQAATIQVGNVTTLEPGQNATVTNVGTSGAAVFDFGIPKGETAEIPTLYAHQITITSTDKNTGVALTIINDSGVSIGSFSSLKKNMRSGERIPMSGGIGNIGAGEDWAVYPAIYLEKQFTSDNLRAYFQKVNGVHYETWTGSTSGFKIIDDMKRITNPI